MNYYLAPMEGITGYIHRNAHHTFFPGIAKYYTAFIAANQYGKLSSKERNDILPEHNRDVTTVPQLMTNKPDDFIATARTLREYGYREINLNLGCPSKTVVNKYRGSGFLAKPEALDAFLDEIFEALPDMKISLKTRIGKESKEEWPALMEIYNRYPVSELIIHPRTQQDFYKNTPHMDVFEEAVKNSRHPVCYNGDLFTAGDIQRFKEQFPEAECVMVGRGLLMNPGLIGIAEGRGAVSKEILKAFHDKVYTDYQEVLFGEKVVLFKMKELWSYMIRIFTNPKKYGKRIRKAERLDKYEEAVEALFKEQDIMKDYAWMCDKDNVNKR